MPDFGPQLDAIMTTALEGSVVRTEGISVAVAGFPAPVGASVEIVRQSGPPLPGEVIGIRDECTLVYPLGELAGIRRGNRVRLRRTLPLIRVGKELLGRVLGADGTPIDSRPLPPLTHRRRLDSRPPPAIERPRINQPLSTGIRAIDALLTCGRGQRMGIFSGSGVGKSVLLGMMARYTSADACVVALVGERGREVNDFLEKDLKAQGLEKSVVVVATSDEPAVTRIRAAYTATAIAEFLRDQGLDVLFLMDSITRFAQAQREIGLAAGEPPTTRGFPPSTFSLLPKLVERTGRSSKGSITAFYSVLVEGDDADEPISDAIRGLLDGHTWLSRDLASRGHYPAIDILQSISRLMPDITPPEHYQAAMKLRGLIAAYRDHEDLISIGAYRPGSNAMVDSAIAAKGAIDTFLRQGVDQRAEYEDTRKLLLALVASFHQAPLAQSSAAGDAERQPPQAQTAVAT